MNQSRTWTRVETAYSEKLVHVGAASSADNPYAFTVDLDLAAIKGQADGSYSASVSAYSTQTKTVTTYTATEWRYSGRGTTCYISGSAWTSSAGRGSVVSAMPTAEISSTVTSSQNYLVDMVGPSVMGWINAESGFVEEGQALNTTLELMGGSAGSDINYTITAISLTNFDGDGNPFTFAGSGSSKFGGSGTGMAEKHAVNSGAFVPCGAPLGDYRAEATVETFDLSGAAFDLITVSLDDTDVHGLAFTTVRTASNLSASNFLVAQIADGSYGTIDAFSVNQTKKKGTTSWTSNIGTIHFAALLTTPGRCRTSGATYSLDKSGSHMILRAPAGFNFVKTGASPFAHTFAGFLNQGSTLDYHEGNLSLGETTSSTPESVYLHDLPVGTGTLGDRIEIDLSRLGTNAADFKVYVRAKLQWVGGGQPTGGALFQFTDSVDNFNSSTPPVTATKSSSYCLVYVDSAGVEHGC